MAPATPSQPQAAQPWRKEEGNEPDRQQSAPKINVTEGSFTGHNHVTRTSFAYGKGRKIPQPVQIGVKRQAYVRAEVEGWIEQKINARD